MGRKANSKTYAYLEESRKYMLAAAASEDFQEFGKRELHELQIRFGFGRVWGVLNFPTRWMAHGTSRANPQRIIDIASLTEVDKSNRVEFERVTIAVTRFVLLMMVTAMYARTTNAQYLAASTVATGARYFCYMVRRLARLTPISKDKLFDRCDVTTLNQIRRSKQELKLLERLFVLESRGYWSDVPSSSVLEADVEPFEPTLVTPGPNSGIEVDESGEAHEQEVVQDAEPENVAGAPKGFLPLPDSLLGELSWRCAWYIRELEPILLKCAKEVAEKLANVLPGKSENLHAYESKQSRVVEKFLKDYTWKFVDKELVEKLEFPLYFFARGNRSPFSWPPRNLSDLKFLINIAQYMHMVVVLLSLAGRISEVLSLDRDDFVVKGMRGRTVKGRTYKWSKRVGGKVRDWPAPEMLELTLSSQRQLIDTITHLRLGGRASDSIGKSIWISSDTGGDVTSQYNGYLEELVKALGLTPLLNGTSVHAHRFRNTIARLMALAVVGAPKILMDLFGHDSVEATLHYILKDPLIRQEMEEIAKAQTIIFAREVIEDVDNCGGPAAEKIQSVVNQEKARLGTEFGAETISELAETFTLSGTQWMLVRPGVLCTKLPHQTGPCNARHSQPDTSRCRSKCEHRLEQAILKNEVDSCIRTAVDHVEQCQRNDDPIGAEGWKGQVANNIDRFPAIRKEWENHPVVRGL